MIRRDFRLPSGEPGWALISQQEHARLSGELARRAVRLPGAGGDREQLIAAIDHHDDGWADWMSRPKLDASGRPVSFMEMELADALTIWSASIDVAQAIGPLAAWVVAGHFSLLLSASESLGNSPQANVWLQDVATERGRWISAWGGPESQAQQALGWLRALDAASLWLCCTCPACGESGQSLSSFKTSDFSAVPVHWHMTAAGEVANRRPEFDELPIELTAAGRQARVREYRDAADLLAATSPCELRWRLGPVSVN